jgi:ubiquinone/menaquinone biosynthesis C-methylase UbiE
MRGDADSGLEYYERRAGEYDATSWEGGADRGVVDRIRRVLSSLGPMRTVDVGCGTGYVSRWLPGQVTLLDASPAMLEIARRRMPRSGTVRAVAPSLPFVDDAFGRAFTANLYGHLTPPLRSRLVGEMLRVAGELVILDQLATSDEFVEGPEVRVLTDGTAFTIHKCHFTVDRLRSELGGGEVLVDGPLLAIVRRRR